MIGSSYHQGKVDHMTEGEQSEGTLSGTLQKIIFSL